MLDGDPHQEPTYAPRIVALFIYVPWWPQTSKLSHFPTTKMSSHSEPVGSPPTSSPSSHNLLPHWLIHPVSNHLTNDKVEKWLLYGVAGLIRSNIKETHRPSQH